MTLLLLLALGVAWQAARAIAWHGWAALELAAAAAALAIAAGARADTAKGYSTEHRVNELARRGWTQSWAEEHIVGNGGSNAISHQYNIPGGQATPGSEYEVCIEGHAHWGTQGNRQDLTLQVRWGATQYATITIPFDLLTFGEEVELWVRGTLTVSADGGHCSAQTTGCMWDTAHLGSNWAFGHAVSAKDHTFNAAPAAALCLWAAWGGTGDSAIHITSYKTRITRRGG